jgi:hypothetical protein
MIGSAGGSFLTKLRAGGKELSISPTAPICTGEDARAYNCSLHYARFGPLRSG